MSIHAVKPLEKSAITLQHAVDSLDELRHRIDFVMNSLIPKSDWIDEQAASGLYFTIESIQKDMGEVRDRIDSARNGGALC